MGSVRLKCVGCQGKRGKQLGNGRVVPLVRTERRVKYVQLADACGCIAMQIKR